MLQKLAIFAGMSDRALAVLLQHVHAVWVDAGDYFCREGEPADALFVLERGEVEIVKSRDGVDVRLSTMGPGDCFGEMALIAIAPRSASVRAMSRSLAMKITNRDLFGLYQDDAEAFAMMVMNMAREVSRRLWVANEIIFNCCGYLQTRDAEAVLAEGQADD